MKPLRIGLATYSMRGGGMETFLLRLGRYLTGKGMEVELATTTEPGAWFDRAGEGGMKAFHVGGWRSGSRMELLRHALRVGRWLRGRDYDALFLNHSLHASGSIGSLGDKTLVVPIFHNDDEAVYDVGCTSAGLWNVAVGVSPKVVEGIRSHAPGRPVELIPYGVEMPSAGMDGKRGPPSAGGVRLIYVGRLDQRQKGVTLLPEILKGCRDRGIECQLEIVGDGSDRPELEAGLRRKGVEDNVRFSGMMPPEGVYARLLGSHALVMPSNYEGLPIALLEALACGCVPVASRLEGITDHAIAEGETGMLAEAGKAEGFVRAIESLASDPGRWKRMSEASRRDAEARFSVEAMGASYRQLIERGQEGAYPARATRRWSLPFAARLLRGWRPPGEAGRER